MGQQPAVRLEQVVYEVGERRILDGVSLRVEYGEIKAVIGLSGSGKTTLLRHVVGLVRPTSGVVFVGEVDITKLSERELDDIRRGTGFVFQGAALFDSLTVFENVAFGLKSRWVLPRSMLSMIRRRTGHFRPYRCNELWRDQAGGNFLGNIQAAGQYIRSFFCGEYEFY